MNYKKYVSLLGITILGLLFVPDFLSLATYIYRLSMTGIILLLSLFLVGQVDNWGLFPEVNFEKLINKSYENSTSASIVFLSFIILISTIIYAIIH